MTAEIPEFVTAEGNVKVTFVPKDGIESLAAVTDAELNAGIHLSDHLMPGWEGIGGEQNFGEQRRFSTREAFQVAGRINRTVAELEYTYLQQMLGTPGSPGNELYEALTPGTDGYLFVGYGVDPALPWSADDVADYVAAQTAARFKRSVGEDEFSPLTVRQGFTVKGTLVEDVVVVAAA